MQKIIVVAMLALLVSLQTPASASEPTVKIVYVEWDCATATSYLAKNALESQGIKVELIPVSAAVMWLSLKTGDADATLTAWLPETHADYYEKSKQYVEDLGPLAKGARLGLAVPDYVPLKSITELNDNADKFGNRIIGIDPGAGLMRLAENALGEYGLDGLELVSGSGATMTAAMAEAMRRQDWIVVTAWSPHWMFGKWKMHYLEDPKGVFGKDESIHKMVRIGLEKDNPRAYAFFKNFRYDDINQLQTLMEWNSVKRADLDANAKKFMAMNPDLVKSWFAN